MIPAIGTITLSDNVKKKEVDIEQEEKRHLPPNLSYQKTGSLASSYNLLFAFFHPVLHHS